MHWARWMMGGRPCSVGRCPTWRSLQLIFCHVTGVDIVVANTLSRPPPVVITRPGSCQLLAWSCLITSALSEISRRVHLLQRHSPFLPCGLCTSTCRANSCCVMCPREANGHSFRKWTEAGFPSFPRIVSSRNTCHAPPDVCMCHLAWHVLSSLLAFLGEGRISQLQRQHIPLPFILPFNGWFQRGEIQGGRSSSFPPPTRAHRSRIPSPLPLHVAKTGRNQLNEEFTPILPTGIGERF